MKKCKQCGCELKADARFCPECGAVVEEVQKDITDSADGSHKKNGSKKKFILAAVIVIGIGIIASFLLLNIKAKNQSKAKEQEKSQQTIQKGKKENSSAEEKKTFRYQWVVNPIIEADQLYYVMQSDASKPYNEYHKQFESSYTVIEKDGLKGWIDDTGCLYTDIKYTNISYATGAGDEICIMKTSDGKYEEYNEYESVQVTEMEEPMDIIDRYDIYGFDIDDDVSDTEIISKETEGLTNNLCWNAGYYYDGETRYVHTSEYGKSAGNLVLEETMPMRKSDKIITTLAEWKNLNGKYAIVKAGEPVTDFIYDECGSENEGLFAVCKDGKWGYVDEKGNEIIPLEYDTSWNRYDKNEAEATNVEATPAEDDYCYAAANGYVNLRKGEKWKLCDIKGNEIIPFGEFEEILPVDNAQYCWVQKDGKWGVIKILEESVASDKYSDWKEVYIDWANDNSEDYTFELVNINNDVVPELVAISNDPSIESLLLSCGNSSYTNSIEIDEKGAEYIPNGNIVKIHSGTMDDYSDEFYKLQNGYWELTGSGRYGTEKNSELQLDENGNPEYIYSWDGEEISKEQYEQIIEKSIPSKDAVDIKEKGVSATEIIDQIKNY